MNYFEDELGVIVPITGKVYKVKTENAVTVYMDAGSYQHLVKMFVGESAEKDSENFMTLVASMIEKKCGIIRVSDIGMSRSFAPSFRDLLLRIYASEFKDKLKCIDIMVLMYVAGEYFEGRPCKGHNMLSIMCKISNQALVKSLRKLETLGLLVDGREDNGMFFVTLTEQGKKLVEG